MFRASRSEPLAPSPRRERFGLPAALALIVGVFVLVGALVGLLWPQLLARPTMTMTREIGLQAINDVEASKLIAMDGWFALLGMSACLVTGAVTYVVFQRYGAWTVLAQLVGAGLAVFVALVVGTATGNGEVILAWHPDVPVATAIEAPVVLHSFGVVALWPVAAVFPVLPLLLLLWNRFGPDDQPGGARYVDDDWYAAGQGSIGSAAAVHNAPRPDQRDIGEVR